MKNTTRKNDEIVRQDPETEFPKVEKLLYNLAWKFSTTYPITFEECRSEAYWAFMKACEDYRPGRGQKFSTWVYYWAWCKLKDLVIKGSKEPIDFVEINEEILGEVEHPRSDYRELVADLSDDAKEIVSLLTETPAELIGVSMTTSQFVKKVKDYMVAKGRDRKTVDKAFVSLQERFQMAWA